MISSVFILYLFIFSFMGIFIFYSNKNIQLKKLYFLLIIYFLFLVLLLYQGKKSDWRAYRSAVNNYSGIGSTYFEIGFDFLLFLAKITIGFELIPIITLSLFFYLCFKMYNCKELFSSNFSLYIFTMSVFLGFLPIYFGAIRQAISSLFLFLLVINTVKRKYFFIIIDFIFAILFHNSSILIVFLLFIISVFNKVAKKHFMILSIIFTAICYIVFQTVLEPLLAIFDQASRVGTADINNNSVGLKDLFILFERIIFLYCSFVLLNNRCNKTAFERQICIYDIVGSLFFIAIYQVARNMAGRTLAFFRMFDVFILYYYCKILFSKNKTIVYNKSNDICMVGIIFYSILRYYITVASAGVF